ncbi:MAG: superoxide dismutase [Bacteroidota bacterium]
MASRRKFIVQSSQAAAAAILVPDFLHAAAHTAPGPSVEIGYTQDPLGYTYAALEPAIDALTMEIHYSKHAATYTKNMTDALTAEKVDFTQKPITELLGEISKYSTKMRNNAGGHYNHEFFWKSLRAPRTFNMPPDNLMKAFKEAFGSFDAFQTQFADAAKSRFGSGWAWLVGGNGKLRIGSTPNQDNPLMDLSELKGLPMLGLDVWEHAYYLKYQNRRADYISSFWSIVNWDQVATRFNYC